MKHVIRLLAVCSLLLAFVLSLALFRGIRAIGIGTVICAFAYGYVIKFFQTVYGKLFRFEDKLPWRKLFEGK